ncbi:Pyrrolo-quinoline quinone [Magnetococcus marinus MC-1]|uniref:Pyrrolo-quinoline quinone n=2 Tax=Magnetococcus TaxID=162171 RepID=A0LDN0_MAGMM|nr:Pyrrolo-quinoline quinone [Magnetococcus marinus MC-1]
MRQGAVIALAVCLGGCSTMDSMTNWFGDEGEVVAEQRASLYTEPAPGVGSGLHKQWDRSITGSPETHLLQPRHIAFDGDSLYAAGYRGDLARIQRDRGNVVWKQDLDVELRGGPAVDGVHVYVGTAEGELVAIYQTDGKVAWRAALSSSAVSAPLVHNGLVMVTTLDNRTYAFDVTSGERRWTHSSVPEALTLLGASTPTVLDADTILVGYSSGEVMAVNAMTGLTKWSDNLVQISTQRTELSNLQDVDADPVVANGQLYVVNHRGQLRALLPSNGSHIWHHNVSAIRPPLVMAGRLVVADLEGYLRALNPQDGTLIWKTQVSDGVLTKPVQLGDGLYVGDDAGRLFRLDPLTGRVVGLDQLGQPILSMTVVGEGVALWSNEGDLFWMK